MKARGRCKKDWCCVFSHRQETRELHVWVERPPVHGACGHNLDISNPTVPTHTHTHTQVYSLSGSWRQTHKCDTIVRFLSTLDAALLTAVDKDKSPKRVSIGRVYSFGSFSDRQTESQPAGQTTGSSLRSQEKIETRTRKRVELKVMYFHMDAQMVCVFVIGLASPTWRLCVHTAHQHVHWSKQTATNIWQF